MRTFLGTVACLAVVCFVKAETCEENHAPESYTKSKANDWFVDPFKDTLQTHNETSECTQTCIDSYAAMLFHPARPREFFCGCQPGYYRPGDQCILCPAEKICPDHSTRAFSCPPDTKPVKHYPKGTRLVHDFAYCVAASGHCTLETNMLQESPLRIFLRDTSYEFLYRVTNCRPPCGKTEDPTDYNCQCQEGFFRDEQGGCQACPPGSYCTKGQSSPCPGGNTSLARASSPVHCDRIECAPGKYLHLGTCVSCPVHHYCQRSEKIRCPLHALTTTIGSATPASCICQRPYHIQPLAHAQHGFACARHPQHEPTFALTPRGQVWPGKANFDSFLSWHAPRDVEGVVGCLARLDTHAMTLQVAVVLPEGSRVYTYQQDAIESFFLHQCALDHLYAEAVGGTAVHAHIYMRCLQRQRDSRQSVLKTVGFAFDGDDATLAVEPQQYFASVRPESVVFITELDLFVELAFDVVDRLESGATTQAKVFDQVKSGLEDRGFVNVTDFLQQGVTAISPRRQPANDTYQVTCHAFGAVQSSAGHPTPAPFLLDVVTVADSDHFCLRVPTAPAERIVEISANTETIEITRGVPTWVLWKDTPLKLEEQTGVNSTAWTKAKAVDTCLDAFTLRFNETLDRLQQLIMHSNFTEYMLGFVYRDEDYAGVSEANKTLFRQSVAEEGGRRKAAIDAGNASQPLSEILFPELPRLALNDSIFFDGRREQHYHEAKQVAMAEFWQVLQTCLNDTRFGETFVLVDAGVEEVTVRSDTVNVTLTSKRGAWEEQCFDAGTCERVGHSVGRRLLTYHDSYDAPPPPPPVASPPTPPPPVASPPVTSLPAPTNVESPAVSLAMSTTAGNMETWLPGLGRRLVLVVNDTETWSVAELGRRACPAHAAASRHTHTCQCLPGYTFNANRMCIPCERHQDCPGEDGPTRLCRDNSTNLPCICADGFFFNRTTNTCHQCPEEHTCIRGERRACSHVERSGNNQCTCRDGYYRPHTGSECRACPYGAFCVNETLHTCPRNKTTTHTHAVSAASCVCAAGYFSVHHANGTCQACALGSYRGLTHSTQTCSDCLAGKTTMQAGATAEDRCVCNPGTKTNGSDCVNCTSTTSVCTGGVEFPCPAHEQADADYKTCTCVPGSFRHNQTCRPCLAGYFCDGDIEPCPPFMTSTPGSQRVTHCRCANADHVQYGVGARAYCACAPSHYQAPASGAQCAPCPANSMRLPSAAHVVSTLEDCRCKPGFYRDAAGHCQECEPGFFCPGDAEEQGRLACPAGTFQPFRQRDRRSACIPCQNASVDDGHPAAHESPLYCFERYLPVQLPGVDLAFLAHTPHASFAVAGDCEAYRTAWLDNQTRDSSYLQIASEQVRCVDGGQTMRVELTPASVQDATRQIPVKVGHGTSLTDSLRDNHALALALPVLFFCDAVLQALPADNTPTCHHGLPSDPALIEATVQLWHGNWAHITNTSEGMEDDLHRMLWKAYDQSTVLVENTWSTHSDFGPRHLRMVRAATASDAINVFPVSQQGQDIVDLLNQTHAKVPLDLAFSNFHEGQLEGRCQAPARGMQGFVSDHAESLACAWFDAPLAGTLCTHCRPGMEFWNATARACQACHQYPAAACETVAPCCGEEDARCLDAAAVVERVAVDLNASLCGNGVVDYDAYEECDWAQPRATHCCTQACTLLEGFIDASCATFCGDGIVAGDEVCDEISPTCKNCACADSLDVMFDRETKQCRLR